MTRHFDEFEKMRNELETMFHGEDGVAEAWNGYIYSNHLGDDKKIYPNTTENLRKFMDEELYFNTLLHNSYDAEDRYFVVQDGHIMTDCGIYNRMDWNIFCNFYHSTIEWKKLTRNATTIVDSEECEILVEITKHYVRFFRRDDCYSSYTYPSFAELKKDNQFRNEVVYLLKESNQFNKEEWDKWIMSDEDMPPFPLSVIFHSEYSEYKYQSFDFSNFGTVKKYGNTWGIIHEFKQKFDCHGEPLFWKVMTNDDGVLWMNNVDGEIVFVENNGFILHAWI